jgi:protein SCO1/2
MGSEMGKEPGTAPGNRGRLRLTNRWAWAVVGVTVAAVVAVAAVRAHVATPTLQGAVVTPPAPTYDFSLLDQDRQPVRLAALHGRAVALTFLYTRCPDVCPLIANKLHETSLLLGDAAKRVAFVAVSVDPTGDTPSAVRAFLQAHRVERELRYLTGSLAELRPIWANYYIGTDVKEVNPQAAAAQAKSPDLVSHTSIVYVIDPRGNLRVFLPGNFDPKDLATDLRILASEAGK